MAVAGGRRCVDLAGSIGAIHRCSDVSRAWAEGLSFEFGGECDFIWLWTPAPTDCRPILPPRMP
jgi:hypothetical protein